MAKETNNNELFSFGKDKTLPMEVLQNGIDTLYSKAHSFKKFADAITNVFVLLLTEADIDIDEEIKEECGDLNEMRLFFLKMHEAAEEN